VTGILLALAFGPLLWLVGAMVFDVVHWILHVMLRSRFAALRVLARPHAVHHEWIDRDLVTNWELQSANIWCHIVPEYLTQLVFTGLVALTLPLPFSLVLFALQTMVFLGILRAKGRDINHRPIPRIDAHPPGWLTPPAYHLLHHAWPDSHYSAYTKLVDRVVGGGAQLAGRRYAWMGPDSPFREAFRAGIQRAGGVADFEEHQLGEVDVLILGLPDAPLADAVESFIWKTRNRQLAPEVWALRASAEDPVARYYLKDPRVAFRTLTTPLTGFEEMPAPHVQRAVRRALFWIRRDAHFIALAGPCAGSSLWRFLRTGPLEPEGAKPMRHRMEFATGR
jgi:hypothetical protein